MTIANTELITIVQPVVALADPHILSDIRDRRSLIDALYDSLVRRAPNGEFIPWLAESWSVDDDSRRWRFRLRADVRCHNGATLTAGDAQASLARAISPEMPGELGTQGVLRGYFDGATIDVTADGLLAIDLQQPLADLLDLLVDIPIVPSGALAALPHQPVGSGPWQLEEQQPGRIVLRAFGQHWAGAPPARQLVWLAEPDAEKRWALFARGDADLLVDPPFTAEPAAAQGEIISRQSYLCIIFLFNLLAGATRDVRVRKALNYAVNLDEIIASPQIAAGHAQPLAGPLTARHHGVPSALQPYRYDPQMARRLLAEAGYADGLTLALALPARFPDESIPLANLVAAQLAAVGVNARLTVCEDRPAYAQRVRDKQFGDISCFDSSPASGWRVYMEKLDSRRQGPWWQGYHSDRLNALLDGAAAIADRQRRDGLLQQAFTLVHEEAPWLFLYAPHHRWAVAPRAAGWQPSAEGRVRITAQQEIKR